jgi:O-antigen biosynthesis protein
MTTLRLALRRPEQWLPLLRSVARVTREKGLTGLWEGIRYWHSQNRPADVVFASDAASPSTPPALPWFFRLDGPYAEWAREKVESPAARNAAQVALARLTMAPRFLVVVLPACAEDTHSSDTLDSLRAQAYDPAHVTVRTLSGIGSANAVNDAVRDAAPDIIAFIRDGDRLAPTALAEMALAFSNHPKADLVYTDEDCRTPDGVPFAPLFKPEFSPDLLDAVPFAARGMAIRRDAFLALGGLRSEVEDAAEYDLALRAAEAGRRFFRIPKPLYQRPATSVAEAFPSLLSSDFAVRRHRAARRALTESLVRRGATGAVVQDGEQAGTFRVVYPLPEPRPLISIIVPFRDRPELLQDCVESILSRTNYAPYELLLVDNGSTEPTTARLLARLSAFPAVRVLRLEMPFNFSAINNTAAREALGEYLVLLNNDTRVISGGWLDEMLRQCARPEVGAVGATLYFPDGPLQHAGVVLGMTGLAGHVWAGLRDNEVPGGWHRHTREVSAVTAACLMTPRTAWEELGGLDERFIVCGNDVDFCLRVRQSGRRVLHVPTARLYHDETQSRDPDKVLPQDLAMSALSYGPYLGRTDPHYNPNLTVATTRATLREPGEPGEPMPHVPTIPVPPAAHPRHVQEVGEGVRPS